MHRCIVHNFHACFCVFLLFSTCRNLLAFPCHTSFMSPRARVMPRCFLLDSRQESGMHLLFSIFKASPQKTAFSSRGIRKIGFRSLAETPSYFVCRISTYFVVNYSCSIGYLYFSFKIFAIIPFHL